MKKGSTVSTRVFNGPGCLPIRGGNYWYHFNAWCYVCIYFVKSRGNVWAKEMREKFTEREWVYIYMHVCLYRSKTLSGPDHPRVVGLVWAGNVYMCAKRAQTRGECKWETASSLHITWKRWVNGYIQLPSLFLISGFILMEWEEWEKRKEEMYDVRRRRQANGHERKE